MTPDPKTDPVGYRILQAFVAAPSTSTSSWRPVFAIAKETGLAPEVVTEYITKHPDLFEQSPLVVSGSALFRPLPDITISIREKSAGANQ